MHIREPVLEDTASLARIQVDTWRTTYHGIVPSDYLAGMMYTDAESRWRERFTHRVSDDWHALVAELDKQVIGFAVSGPERVQDPDYSGEIYALYVLPEYQGRGVGKRLFLESVSKLKSDGLHPVIAWVLEENPNRGFYETLGGELVRRRKVEIGGALLSEVGYGWNAFQHLTSQAAQEESA